MNTKVLPQFSQRSQRVSGKGAIHALAKARQLQEQGLEILHLEAGELDLDTPAHIVQAAVNSLRNGRTRYSSSQGIQSLREEIARYINSTRSTVTSPTNVVVTPGVKGAIFAAIMALIESGDEVIVPDPGFPSYEAITKLAGGTAVPWRQTMDNDFAYDIDQLQSIVNNKTKLIVINNPNNPTGTIMSIQVLESISEIALKHNLWVISDEIYSQLYFNRTFPTSIFSIPGMAERTILMDGFSKAYAMTGWRLGFGIFPNSMIERVCSIILNDYSCLPEFVQDAGTAALQGPQVCVDIFREELRSRRDLVVNAINAMSYISCFEPEGALYVMIDISELQGIKSQQFAETLLLEGVSLLPGTILSKNGEHQIRLAYTTNLDNLADAMHILDSTVSKLAISS